MKVKMKTSILVTCLFLMATMSITPILADIQATFKGSGTTAIQMINTLPNLFVIIFTLVAGFLAARFSKKSLVIIGLCFVLAAGIGGFFFNSSLILLYIWSICLGIGMGLFSPVIALIINEEYDGKERGDMLGYQTTFNNLGSIILSTLAGFLAVGGWKFGYLSYLLAIPVLLIVVFFMKSDKPATSNGGKPKSTKINGTVLYYTALVVIFVMTYNVYATNVAMFTIQEHLGNASTAGLANSISLVGGLLGGFLFGKISDKIHNLMMPLGYVLIAIGFLLTYSANSLMVACIGAFIAGVSISFFMPQAIFATMHELTPEYITMGLSIVSTFGSLGAFISPLVYTTAATAIMGNDTAKSRFLFVGIVALLLAIVMAIIVTVRQKKTEA